MKLALGIQIDEAFQGQVEEAWLRGVVTKTLEAESVPSPAEVSLVITDDKALHDLNRRYRGLDEPTDVLAFSFLEGGAFVAPPDGLRHLGEVFISLPRARAQAGEAKHPFPRELAHLLVHGLLHLLGYEHEEAISEMAMRGREDTILAQIPDLG